MTDYSPADKQVALDFAASVNLHDYLAAVQALANVFNAGNGQLAAELLGGLVEAGVTAVEERAGRSVTVTQTIGVVPEGASVVGFKGGRIGR